MLDANGAWLPASESEIFRLVRRIVNGPDALRVSTTTRRGACLAAVLAVLLCAAVPLGVMNAHGETEAAEEASSSKKDELVVSDQQSAASAANIHKLIQQLGDETYARRESAQKELVKICLPAMEALKRASKHDDAEIAHRAESALAEIAQHAEERRRELRQAAREAGDKGDPVAATRCYEELLALPAAQLRDCRAAAKFFESREDWASYAIAQEATADCMRDVMNTPVEEFLRPATQQPGPERTGPVIGVQTGLDGEWSNGKGTAENWIPWLKRKQNGLVSERFFLLGKLGRQYRDKLHQPEQAARVFAKSLGDVPFFTEPLDQLIARTWPVHPRQHNSALRAIEGGYLQALNELADVQEQASDLNAAIDARTRALLLGFCMAPHYHDGTVDRNAHQLRALVRQLPADAPRPPLFWFNVLGKEKDTIVFDLPQPRKDGNLDDVYGLNVVPRPETEFDTLEITADLEDTRLICSTVINGKSEHVGMFPSPGQGRRQTVTKTFKVPDGASVIHLGRVIGKNKELDGIHKIMVKAHFKPN